MNRNMLPVHNHFMYLTIFTLFLWTLCFTPYALCHEDISYSEELNALNTCQLSFACFCSIMLSMITVGATFELNIPVLIGVNVATVPLAYSSIEVATDVSIRLMRYLDNRRNYERIQNV